jgi:hypothetical protein
MSLSFQKEMGHPEGHPMSERLYVLLIYELEVTNAFTAPLTKVAAPRRV